MIEELQPYITTIVQALLGLLVAAILAGVTVLRRKLEAWLEARTTAQQRDTLHKLATEGAALIEAMYKDMEGPAKLSQAYDYVSGRLRALGIDMSGDSIRAAIEKAVQDYNLQKKGAAALASTQQQ